MIRLIQVLCPARHCIAATAYDTANHTTEHATGELIALLATAGIRPLCGICGSTHLNFEDNATAFTSIDEARPTLTDLEAKQLESRRRMDAAGLTHDSKRHRHN